MITIVNVTSSVLDYSFVVSPQSSPRSEVPTVTSNMPWIFEASILSDPPGRRWVLHILDDEIQQILNVAANEGKTSVTFASWDTSAPFTKVCFKQMQIKLKNQKYSTTLMGHWSKPGDRQEFTLAMARYFAIYGDIIGHGPAPTPPVEPIATVASCVPEYQ